ncbi:histidine kinase [Azohydromonas aeria]|uniref:histidine kinase n=1 Tax=Azohydromonas aeria TaxID=2590212 RepID=UPI0018DFA856|nr:histidine kinase [Azohydromonas aeria]
MSMDSPWPLQTAAPRLWRADARNLTLAGVGACASIAFCAGLALYRQAAAVSPGLPWQVPALLGLQGLCLLLVGLGLALLRRDGTTPAASAVRPTAVHAHQHATAAHGPGRDAQALSVLARAATLYGQRGLDAGGLRQALALLREGLCASRVCLQLESAACQPLHCGPILEALAPPDCERCGPGTVDEADLRLPLRRSGTLLGTLLIQRPGAALPPPAQHLAEAFAGLTALAIAEVCRGHEERRMALMEERSAIAAELHDSLSQSLAFMKIQVAQLQRAARRETQQPALAQAVDELRDGLSAAYRQVRELIAAFRTQLHAGGLAAAVQEAVEELRQRSGLDTVFEHDIAGCRLEPNEEFHVMQIVREALFNTVKHAGATRARVDMRLATDGRLHVRIEDDGCGLPADPGPRDHHGLAVMQQRAQALGGRLALHAGTPRGTVVALDFAPQGGVAEARP